MWSAADASRASPESLSDMLGFQEEELRDCETPLGVFYEWLEEEEQQQDAQQWQYPCAGAAPPAMPNVHRLLEIHRLAEAAADALLLGQPLLPTDEAALLELWPALIRLTAGAPGAAASADASPFAAAAACTVLAQRPTQLHVAAPHVLCLPSAGPRGLQPGATACTFELAAPPADAAAAAELQVFAQQLVLGVEQSSKEALEETLSELSALPGGAAVSMVRRSIEGGAGGLPPVLPLRDGAGGSAQSGGALTPRLSLMMRRASTGGCSRAGSVHAPPQSSNSTPAFSLRSSSLSAAERPM